MVRNLVRAVTKVVIRFSNYFRNEERVTLISFWVVGGTYAEEGRWGLEVVAWLPCRAAL